MSLNIVIGSTIYFCFVFSQGFCFGKAGEILTMRLRSKAFNAMMRQVKIHDVLKVTLKMLHMTVDDVCVCVF